VSGALAFAAGTHSDRHFASVFVTAPDGLRLHIRSYGSRVASALPVVCLAALTRTAADFHPLAAGLAADPAKPRLVLAIDYRGHGQSEYDRNPDNYTLPVALADRSAILTALEIAPLTLNPIARRLDSERVEPFVDISGLFAAKCPQ